MLNENSGQIDIEREVNGVVDGNAAGSVDGDENDTKSEDMPKTYLRGFTNAVSSISSVVYGRTVGDDDTVSTSGVTTLYGVYSVYGLFTVVWLLTWCIVGLLLSKVFKRVKRACFQ
eukprot:GDKI01001848.1.p1 GENE.GDKI01001848.1~~GDKI01001848.1.p1  ORF type:complete len:116 (-),score=9.71 GDKI01001848.1:54-401(-)